MHDSETLHQQGATVPILAAADPINMACALVRAADLFLSWGHAKAAEHLARRAEALRKAAQ